MLINAKMLTNDGILTFMSMMNLMFSCVEHEISIIFSGIADSCSETAFLLFMF